ncbi:MAG: hypothetical protein FWC36_00280 [Spirochaetes bacterium]|nr:hypothetical protein [Spirochaetota bacterium]
MSFHNFIHSRIIALVVLIAFVAVSCNPFFGTDSSGGLGDETIFGTGLLTPGVGTPRFAYLDSSGNLVNHDTGTTLLVVEGNRYAEGVWVKADNAGRVSLIYDDILITMFFNQGSNFPSSMIFRKGLETINGYFSAYNPDTQTFSIIFEQDGEFDSITGIVMNRALLSLYADDPALSPSQNQRLRNMTIALSIYMSLFASFEAGLIETGEDTHSLIQAFFGRRILRTVRQAFTVVAIAATAVAYVVAPAVAFINPALGAAIYAIARPIAYISTLIAAGLWEIEKALSSSSSSNQPVVSGTSVLPVIVEIPKQGGGTRRMHHNEVIHVGSEYESFDINIFALGWSRQGFNLIYTSSNKNWHVFDPSIRNLSRVPDSAHFFYYGVQPTTIEEARQQQPIPIWRYFPNNYNTIVLRFRPNFNNPGIINNFSSGREARFGLTFNQAITVNDLPIDFGFYHVPGAPPINSNVLGEVEWYHLSNFVFGNMLILRFCVYAGCNPSACPIIITQHP